MGGGLTRSLGLLFAILTLWQLHRAYTRRAWRHVALTTVDQGRERLGELAIEALIERIECGRTEAVHHVIAPSLVIRDTTAAPSSSCSI